MSDPTTPTPATEPQTTVELIKATIEKEYAWLKGEPASVWDKVNNLGYQVLSHVKSLSHIAAFASATAVLVKLAHSL